MGQLRFGKERKRINLDLIREIVTWTFQIAVVCLIAFVFVWYFGQRVSCVGDSMNPVLENGDITLTNRIIYNMSSPKRGDLIAFQPNGNENARFYIKRIIGLPGEKVEIRDGKIYIDDKELRESYVTTEIQDVGILEEPMVLKNDEYFVLGDDRQNSEDSRMAEIGNVKRSEIKGKVWFVISPRRNFGFVK